MKMLWHIVKFDLGELRDRDRTELESALTDLQEIEGVRGFVMGRDPEKSTATVVMIAFDDLAALSAYRLHPFHVDVVNRLRTHGVSGTSFNLVGDLTDSGDARRRTKSAG